MKFGYLLRFVFLVVILQGCAAHRSSVLVGVNYDASKDCTDYLVLPYGSASIPGKWVKTHFNDISNQQFFMNRDSIRISIAFTRFDQYEFNPDGTKTGYDFVKAFYKWECDYFEETFGLACDIIEENEYSTYMIYRLYGTVDGGEFDSYFLVGNKNGNISNLSVMATDQWAVDEKIAFLKNLFGDGEPDS